MKVTLDNTIGAAFLGLSVSCILFGIAIVQAHLYYLNFPKDWTFQKVSVGILMILATVDIISTVHAMYYYLIVNFGNPSGLETMVWSFKLQVLVNILMIIFVQGLYAVRVWKLGNHFSRFGPAVAGFIVAGGWVVGLLLVGRLYGEVTFATLDTLSPLIDATFVAATTIDAVIASLMCYYLSRSRSSFFVTNNKIFIVMRYVLITGCLTSACSLSGLITYLTMPHNMVFIGIDFLLPIIYVNSYIAMLNARISMNESQRSSADVSKLWQMRSGLIPRMDIDGAFPSATRFASNFSNMHEPEQDMSSKELKIVVHRTEEQL